MACPDFSTDCTTVEHSGELDALAAAVVLRFRAAPCAVVGCAYRDGGGWKLSAGASGSLDENGEPPDLETPFDLASLTKPFTALALARMVRSEIVSFGTQLGVLLREALGTPSAEVPLELFLAHRSGLEGHRPLYAPLTEGAEVQHFWALAEAARARLPGCCGAPGSEGFAPTYSDLGYLLLGEAMSRASGTALDKLIEREVCDPLGARAGSARQWWERDPSFEQRVAPTEVIAWRGGLIRGAVHDENAWALGVDGVCGHAGLFGTVRDVLLVGAGVLDALASRAIGWLAPAEIEPLVRPRPGGSLRAGFDGKSDTGSSAGSRCSSGAFGHLGFTGTSLWIDPTREIVLGLLSNRVHPTRDNDAIKQARPEVHDALFAWAEERLR